MKNILISFIRNEHLACLKEDHYRDLDITQVAESRSIDKIFLLTNQDREESISFKNWIADKLDLEVKAVTLEKGSEKYILGKIESIIKYILLAEEGHATFFYLPGENTLQINLWEIIDKTIYKGQIIYPGNKVSETPKVQPVEKKKIEKPVKKAPQEKIFTVKAPPPSTPVQPEEKAKTAVNQRTNLLICGEEGTGKRTLAEKVIRESGLDYHSINFRSVNPARIDDKADEICARMEENGDTVFLLLNIEVLPFYLQERFSEYSSTQIISTVNVKERSDLDSLNKKFYYALSTTLITLEPLRARKEEFAAIATSILQESGGKTLLSDKALEYLQRHNWPGNFNELQSLLSRLVAEGSPMITEEQVENALDRPEQELDRWRSVPMGENFNLNDVLGEVAMHYIVMALEICDGKKSKAARMLGFSNYQTLSNWMKKYGK